MFYSKKNKAISKGLAMGIITTSVVPAIALNDNIIAQAEEATSDSQSTGKVVEVMCEALRVRSGASADNSIVGTVSEGTYLEYVSTCKNGWYKVKYKDGIGYVSDYYTKLVSLSSVKNSIQKIGRVESDTLNVRSGPGTRYTIKKTIKKGSVVGILSLNTDGWSKVRLSNFTTGYVNKEYLDISSGSYDDIDVDFTTTQTSSETSKKLEKVLDTVKSKVGRPYVYGAAGPNYFDCSGLMYYCYKQAGVYLNRTSVDQARDGKYVSKNNLQPGDLVFFNSGTSSIHHVGMYVGNDKFIHAPSPGKSVKYENLNSSYYTRGYVTARRIIE